MNDSDNEIDFINSDYFFFNDDTFSEASNEHYQLLSIRESIYNELLKIFDKKNLRRFEKKVEKFAEQIEVFATNKYANRTNEEILRDEKLFSNSNYQLQKYLKFYKDAFNRVKFEYREFEKQNKQNREKIMDEVSKVMSDKLFSYLTNAKLKDLINDLDIKKLATKEYNQRTAEEILFHKNIQLHKNDYYTGVRKGVEKLRFMMKQERITDVYRLYSDYLKKHILITKEDKQYRTLPKSDTIKFAKALFNDRDLLTIANDNDNLISFQDYIKACKEVWVNIEWQRNHDVESEQFYFETTILPRYL